MSDRRRVNGPVGSTLSPIFAHVAQSRKAGVKRARKPNELRKIFLQTGLIPSASGSAYLELESSPLLKPALLVQSSTIKLSCAVHGPKPLPRNAAFSPNLQLTASVKFAPFATRARQGYVPDSTEKDLGMHLENALKGVIIPDRWPKSALDVVVTVLESEDGPYSVERIQGVGLFNLLAGCINVSMAALADARIDCLDLLVGGVGAVISGPDSQPLRVLDPVANEHEVIHSSCLVGYLPSRDEVVEMWSSGSVSTQENSGGSEFDELFDSAVAAARGAQTVLKQALIESLQRGQLVTKKSMQHEMNDVEMST